MVQAVKAELRKSMLFRWDLGSPMKDDGSLGDGVNIATLLEVTE
jgi:hypothetical protein